MITPRAAAIAARARLAADQDRAAKVVEKPTPKAVWLGSVGGILKRIKEREDGK